MAYVILKNAQLGYQHINDKQIQAFMFPYISILISVIGTYFLGFIAPGDGEADVIVKVIFGFMLLILLVASFRKIAMLRDIDDKKTLYCDLTIECIEAYAEKNDIDLQHINL